MNKLLSRLVCGLIVAGALAAPAAAQDSAVMEEGKRVYDKWCTPCHGPNPEHHPGTMALEALYEGEKPAPLEERTDLTPEIVAQFVREGVSIMPFFRKTEISDQELDALGAYLSRNGD